MGTDRNRKRIEKIENSLTPSEIVASWVESLAKFDSFKDYALWVAEDPSRAPLPKMFQQVESSIPGHPAGGGKRSSDKNSSRELLRNRLSNVLFPFYLILEVNRQARELLGQEEIRVAAITAGVHATKERLSTGMAMFELWKGLNDTAYPLDPDIAAAVSWALRSEVTGIDDLASAIAGQQPNPFADQVTNERAPSETCERLKRAVYDLCHRGLVKRGSCVTLDPTPIGVLSELPLVDGVWIDRMAVELAEFVATLCERGIKLCRPADPHPLAPLQPRRSKEVPGEQKAGTPSEDEIAETRAEAAARLAGFAGRTREIYARRYLHLDDYRAWSGRKAGEVTEGVVTKSWNTWVEACDDAPELAGIRVGKLDPVLQDEDFFSCEDPARRRRREERASLIGALMLDRKEISELEVLIQAYRVTIRRLSTEVRGIMDAAQRLTSRYFPGLNVVFRSSASALNELAAGVELLAEDYNKLVGFVVGASKDGIISDARFAGRIKKIDLSATDPAAEEAASTMVRNAVIFAKAQTLSFFHEDTRAVEILKPMLRGEINQSQGSST